MDEERGVDYYLSMLNQGAMMLPGANNSINPFYGLEQNEIESLRLRGLQNIAHREPPVRDESYFLREAMYELDMEFDSDLVIEKRSKREVFRMYYIKFLRWLYSILP